MCGCDSINKISISERGAASLVARGGLRGLWNRVKEAAAEGRAVPGAVRAGCQAAPACDCHRVPGGALSDFVEWRETSGVSDIIVQNQPLVKPLIFFLSA